MGKKILEAESGFLVTKEKLPDRFLFTGKISCENTRSGYIFYLFEIFSPWAKIIKVKKAVLDILNKRIVENDYSEAFFEEVINEVNEGLNTLAESGENEWIGNINAIIGLISNDELFIAQAGKISGYIFRKGKISSLTESQTLIQTSPLQTFSDIISGGLVDDDKIVFGNRELYNHLSLDRIRRITEQLTAKESILELYRDLKKYKIVDVNAIVIEAKDINSAEDKIITEIPEVIYLDQVKDSLLKIAQKKLSPKIKAYYKKSKELTRAGAIIAKEKGSLWFHKSKIYIGKKIQSKKTDNLEQEFPGSNQDDKYKRIKVKTKNYRQEKNSKTYDFFQNVISIAANSWLVISKKEYRKYLYLALIFIFLLSGYLKIRSNNIHRDQLKAKIEIANAYDQAKDLFASTSEAIALGKTTDTAQLYQALELATKAEESPADKDNAVKLVRQIRESIDKIEKITRFYDLSPSFKLGDASINKFILAGSEIFGINEEGKIYSGNILDNQVKLVGSVGKENSETLDMAYLEAQDKIIILTAENKVYSYETKSKAVAEVTLQSGDWGKPTSIDVFSSNIYSLDNNSVMKFIAGDATYSAGAPSITAKKIESTNCLDLAIDGSIFILTADGHVKKFTRGSHDTNFSLKPLPDGKNIADPGKIFTDVNTNYIYVNDKTNQKIVKFDKNGQFVKQYAIDGVNIDDFAINEKIKKGWALSAGQVYQFDL